MVIWMPQLGSVRQLDLDITLKGVLTVVGSAIAGAEEAWAEFGRSSRPSLHTFPTHGRSEQPSMSQFPR